MLCQDEESSAAVVSDRIPATVLELIDEYGSYGRRVRDLAEDTLKEQCLYLDRFLAAQPERAPPELLASLTPARVQRFVFDYAKAHGPGSRRWMQFSLRSFLRFCYHRGYTSSDLSNAVPAFRSRRLASVPKGIDDDTTRLLMESIDACSPVGLRDLAIIQLLVTYGVRGIQVRQLRLDDVDWADDRIQFRAVKRGKTVVQHLTPEVGNSLLAYIRDARPSTVPYAEVFLTSRAPFRPITSSGAFSSIISRRLRRADVQLPKGMSHGAHPFRHAFAGRLTGHVPLKHIADMLGHRDLSSAYLYSKVDFKALAETALPWPEEVGR